MFPEQAFCAVCYKVAASELEVPTGWFVFICRYGLTDTDDIEQTAIVCSKVCAKAWIDQLELR